MPQRAKEKFEPLVANRLTAKPIDVASEMALMFVAIVEGGSF